jgi:hypothetical protein
VSDPVGSGVIVLDKKWREMINAGCAWEKPKVAVTKGFLEMAAQIWATIINFLPLASTFVLVSKQARHYKNNKSDKATCHIEYT